MFILGNVAGVFGASGDGYLCEAHFHVIGSACNTSALDVAEGKLFDTSGTGAQIPADWINGSVHVSAFDADFSADSGIAGYPTEGYATVTAFNFTNKSTGGMPPYSYEWDFGDGMGNSPDENLVYIYTVDGTCTVALRVTDSLLSEETETKENYLMAYWAGGTNTNSIIDMVDVTKLALQSLSVTASVFGD